MQIVCSLDTNICEDKSNNVAGTKEWLLFTFVKTRLLDKYLVKLRMN